MSLAASSVAVHAQVFHMQPSVAAEVDATDNVNLDPGGSRRTDVVTQITPTLKISERGAHTTLSGTISAPILLYARTGSQNNAVRPEVALAGNAELISRLLFVDASATVSQQYVSPFGPRPANLINATSNRTTAQSYAISPYLKGMAANDIDYELRDTNTWTVANGIATIGNHAYTNDILGHVARQPRPMGWALDYSRIETQFTDSGSLVTESERGSVHWRPDAEWELEAIGGYEDNRYPLATYTSAIYGLGGHWHPDDRTNANATFEHRFFGTSYHADFTHRAPLSVWSLRASRDITSYPQQLANLGPGVDVNGLLNQVFSGRVTDPVERQTLVDQLIRDRGLPSVLTSPLALFSQQITLQQLVQGTAGLIGARNTVFLTIYHVRSEPIVSSTASTLDALVLAQTDNTQSGAGVTWTHQLTALYSLSTGLDWSRTTANQNTTNGANANSRQGTFHVAISAPLSPLTNLFAGARYQRLWSDVNSGYREAAVFAGITHLFR